MRTDRRLTISAEGVGEPVCPLNADPPSMQTPLPPKADPPCGQTNTCENITFPIFRMRSVIINKEKLIAKGNHGYLYLFGIWQPCSNFQKWTKKFSHYTSFLLQFYKDTLSENGDKEKNGESTEDVEMVEDGM